MSGQPIDGTRHGGRHASSPQTPKPRPTTRTARCQLTLTDSPSAAAPQPPTSSTPRWATGEQPRTHQPAQQHIRRRHLRLTASGSSSGTVATSARPAFSHVSSSTSGSSSGRPANGSGSGIVRNPEMGSDGLQVGIHCIKALVHTLNEPVLHLHEIGLGGVPDPRPREAEGLGDPPSP